MPKYYAIPALGVAVLGWEVAAAVDGDDESVLVETVLDGGLQLAQARGRGLVAAAVHGRVIKAVGRRTSSTQVQGRVLIGRSQFRLDGQQVGGGPDLALE